MLDWYDVDCEAFELHEELAMATQALDSIRADCEHLEPSEGLLGDLAEDAKAALSTVEAVMKRLDIMKEAARKNDNNYDLVADFCEDEGADTALEQVADYLEKLGREQRYDADGVRWAESHLECAEVVRKAASMFGVRR